MLLAAALTAQLLAAAPVAPRQAEVVLVLKSPRSEVPALREFLTEASAYAPVLNPGRLATSLSGPLQADLLDLGSLESAGVSLDSPITLAFDARGSVTCLSTKGKAAAQRLDTSLGATAPAARQTVGAVRLAGATAGTTWRAGYAAKGEQLCIASDQPDALAVLRSAAEALAGKGLDSTKAWTSATAGLSGGPLLFFRQDDVSGALVLKPSKSGLTASGRALSAKPWIDRPHDADPLAQFAPAAPIAVRATLAPALLADAKGPAGATLSYLFSLACPKCEASAWKALHTALLPALSGSAAWVSAGLDPTAAAQPYEGYFLYPHAYLFGLKDPAAARKALAEAVEKMRASGATVAEDGGEGAVALGVGTRQAFAGVVGPSLYLANDKAARELARAAAASAPAKAPHAASAAVAGELASTALRRISVFDVGKSSALAGLYAVALQAGPLLRASALEAFADSEGAAAKLELRWTLKPVPSIAPPTPPASSASPP